MAQLHEQPRRRRAIVDAMVASQDLLAAGFRSPELVERTLGRMQRDYRAVMREFMSKFEVVLGSATPESGSGPSPASPGSGAPVDGTNKRRLTTIGKGPRPANRNGSPPATHAGPSAAVVYRDALIGTKPRPPGPEDLEIAIDDRKLEQGLIHGEVQPMLTFLARYPAVEKFLGRHLAGDVDLFDRTGKDDALSTAGATEDLRTGGLDSTLRGTSAASLQPESGLVMTNGGAGAAYEDVDEFVSPVRGEHVSVIDAFTQANMLWLQAFPVDIGAANAALSRSTSSDVTSPVRGGGGQPEGGTQETQQTMLLRANLALHYPESGFDVVLAVRDNTIAELSKITEEAIRSSVGADARSEDLPCAANGRLVLAATNCRDGLQLLPIHASPDDLRTALQDRFTRLLEDTTMVAHDAGLDLSGLEAASASPATNSGGKSILGRIKSKALGKKSEEEARRLNDVGHVAYRLQMCTKHNLKALLSSSPTRPQQASSLNHEESG